MECARLDVYHGTLMQVTHRRKLRYRWAGSAKRILGKGEQQVVVEQGEACDD